MAPDEAGSVPVGYLRVRTHTCREPAARGGRYTHMEQIRAEHEETRT
ncbi:hypothetical protein J2853_006420 [Streptosporangium lutulentum]|uniref:Uncharacterized protein n=1 Tax=Streptosporangium lutulentum TaxID=1461250 RepID=A0ABT9QMR0_9ACTN|nr:hypothetical protein [Streptosporangium lutulentum]